MELISQVLIVVHVLGVTLCLSVVVQSMMVKLQLCAFESMAAPEAVR